LKDSKKLTAKQRVELSAIIKEEVLDWSIDCATIAELEQLNISNATLLFMH